MLEACAGQDQMCGDNVEETQIKIKRDGGMSATLDYLGSMLEFTVKFCRAKHASNNSRLKKLFTRFSSFLGPLKLNGVDTEGAEFATCLRGVE